MSSTWGYSARPRRMPGGRRAGRPSRAIVEMLERRDLLAVKILTPGPVAGQPFTAAVAQFNTDSTFTGNSVADYSATVSWDNAGDAGAGTIKLISPGVFDVLGSFTYPTEGSKTVSVTVTQAGTNGHEDGVGTLTVAAAPVSSLGLPVAGNPGVELQAVKVAAFSSANPFALPGDFTATIDWGDKSGSDAAGTIVTNPQGGFFVEGSHPYASAGTFITTIKIMDAAATPSPVVAQSTGTAVITAPLIPAIKAAGTIFAAPLGLPINPVVATFTDSNLADNATSLRAVINWGDGQTSVGRVEGGGPVGFTVTGTHTFATAGTTNIQTTIYSTNGQTATVASSAIVNGPSLVATGLTFPITPGQPFRGLVARFTDSALPAGGAGASALIDWGDGSTTLGTISGPDGNGQFSVTGTYTYPSGGTAGSFAVRVTISDPTGQRAVATSTALVVNAGPTFGFSGGLAPSSDTGPLRSGIFTNTNRPTLAGTAAPFALVQLAATTPGVDATIPLGQTVAGPTGQWSLTVGPLLDGYYTVAATVTSPGGYPTPAPLLANGGVVVVDPTPPQVVSAAATGFGNSVLVTFRDATSGPDPASLLNPANYQFVGPRGNPVAAAVVVPWALGTLPTDPVTVLVAPLGLNPRLRGLVGGLRILGQGITDRAGNPLQAAVAGLTVPFAGPRPRRRRR